ncbi:hypothetical protein SCACP_36760 [Sporomusa carbonis]
MPTMTGTLRCPRRTDAFLAAKDLPNRIVADAMTGRFIYAEPDMPLWHASETLEQDKLSALLAREQDLLKGLVTPAIIKQELGKHTDLLTGLYRTDYLYYHALKLMSSGREISVAFADIDNFGEINKRYGHVKGDLILKEFGALLQAHTPPETILCRFGGDEFIILMSCSRETLAAFAHKLRQAVAGYTFPDNIPVTMSVGVATAGRMSDRSLPHGRLLASLINKASLASTSAKKDNSGIKNLEQTTDSESA